MEMLHKKRLWISLTVLVTLLFAVFYLGVQQALRLGANEPQSSMVNDIAAKLNEGRRPDSLVTSRVDMARDMAPFVIIYDTFGKVVKGNGYLDGNVPQVPIGILHASDKGTHKVTWQPKPDVRIAAVSRKAGDNYVLGGRNLEVVENKISNVTAWLIALWLLSLVLLAVLYSLFRRKDRSSQSDATSENA
jgi:preprotein translocase subunit SecG